MVPNFSPFFFRIERNGRGFYTDGSCVAGLMYASYYEDESETKHPAPRNDSRLRAAFEAARGGMEGWHIDPYRFGFASIAQLRNWIYRDEWLDMLTQEGFMLKIYLPTEMFVGNTQAMAIISGHAPIAIESPIWAATQETYA